MYFGAPATEEANFLWKKEFEKEDVSHGAGELSYEENSPEKVGGGGWPVN